MTECSVSGCEKPAKCRTYCDKHYTRWKRHGDPETVYVTKGCLIEGCEKKHKARGYCETHWWRIRNFGDPLFTPRVEHGLVDTPAYRSWSSMKSRCNNPKDPSYHHYGGRGIKVCARWHGFLEFLEDMGERPDWATGGIDRINVDGNYEPENCRWATSHQQANNRRLNTKGLV